MSARVYLILFFSLGFTTPVLAQPMPFDICTESMTWIRPTPEVQAVVWNDARYKSFARDAYEWTHDFFVLSDPQSASAHDYFSKATGLWTALRWGIADVLRYDDKAIAAWTSTHDQAVDKCPSGRSANDWIEVWSLFNRVRQVQRDKNTYTVTVETVIAGFQMIYIRRVARSAVLRFVTPDGKQLERWDESAPPNRVKNTFPPGKVPEPLIVPARK